MSRLIIVLLIIGELTLNRANLRLSILYLANLSVRLSRWLLKIFQQK